MDIAHDLSNKAGRMTTLDEVGPKLINGSSMNQTMVVGQQLKGQYSSIPTITQGAYRRNQNDSEHIEQITVGTIDLSQGEDSTENLRAV
jgi:hypothetical protein